MPKSEHTAKGAVLMALASTFFCIAGCLVKSGNRLTLDQFQQCIDDRSTGAVRISFGIASTFTDAHTVFRFFQEFVEP